LPRNGHAIQARVYAEDPDEGFLPMSGEITGLDVPSGPGIRVDHAIAPGTVISPHYDPMVMKVMAHGSDREVARRRLIGALREARVAGIATNLGYLQDLCDAAFMREAKLHTGILDAWKPERREIPPEALLLLSASLEGPSSIHGRGSPSGHGAANPFVDLGPFRVTPGNEAR
jgi:acetyl/propionyl-CoA carboxylase alpha subunit